MAITNNGTKVSVPAAQIPTGYSKPTITEVSGDELYINQTTINILKTAVENSNEVTAFTALVSAINVAAAALVDVAFTTTETTTFYTEMLDISSNQCDTTDTVQYNTTVESFDVVVVIRVQVVEVT